MYSDRRLRALTCNTYNYILDGQSRVLVSPGMDYIPEASLEYWREPREPFSLAMAEGMSG